jgi:hypothetical protein
MGMSLSAWVKERDVVIEVVYDRLGLGRGPAGTASSCTPSRPPLISNYRRCDHCDRRPNGLASAVPSYPVQYLLDNLDNVEAQRGLRAYAWFLANVWWVFGVRSPGAVGRGTGSGPPELSGT